MHEPDEEYAGPATVEALDKPDGPFPVEVQLRGHFEPIDGRFRWYGRIATNPALDDQYRSGARVSLATPHGTAEGRLSDLDAWGRFRITGTGRPPF